MFLFHFACCVTTVSDSLQHKMVGKECEGEELIHNRVRVRAKYTLYNLRGLREISSCADVVSLKNGPYKIMLPSSLFAFTNNMDLLWNCEPCLTEINYCAWQWPHVFSYRYLYSNLYLYLQIICTVVGFLKRFKHRHTPIHPLWGFHTIRWRGVALNNYSQMIEIFEQVYKHSQVPKRKYNTLTLLYIFNTAR